MKRPYTGDKRPVAKGPTPHIVTLVAELEKKYPALWNNGIFAVREMRSKKQMSVHAKGTAADVSYRHIGNKGVRFGGRKQALEACNFLVENADALGIEMIIDYKFGAHGRAYRCDRDAWMVYKKPTVQFGGSGDWLHIECDGKKSPKQVRDIFRQTAI
jgi:hypothetical protein